MNHSRWLEAKDSARAANRQAAKIGQGHRFYYDFCQVNNLEGNWVYLAVGYRREYLSVRRRSL